MVDYALYTDGSCIGNPWPGGRGAVVIQNAEWKMQNWNVIKLAGKSKDTTNNQMELQAVIEGLKWIKKAEKEKSNPLRIENSELSIEIVTDSNYVKSGIEEWIENWKTNGWKTYRKKPIKNKELRQELNSLVGLFDIKWSWVKGHAGNTYNEMADKLANGNMLVG